MDCPYSHDLVDFEGTITSSFDGKRFKINGYEAYVSQYEASAANTWVIGTRAIIQNAHRIKFIDEDGYENCIFGICNFGKVIVKESIKRQTHEIEVSVDKLYYWNRTPMKYLLQFDTFYDRLSSTVQLLLPHKSYVATRKALNNIYDRYGIPVVDPKESPTHSLCWFMNEFESAFPTIHSVDDYFKHKSVQDSENRVSEKKSWAFQEVLSTDIFESSTDFILGVIRSETQKNPYALSFVDESGSYPIVFDVDLPFSYTNHLVLVHKFKIITENVLDTREFTLYKLPLLEKMKKTQPIQYIFCSIQDIQCVYFDVEMYNIVSRCIELRDYNLCQTYDNLIVLVLSKSDIINSSGDFDDQYFVIQVLIVDVHDISHTPFSIRFSSDNFPKWHMIQPGNYYFIQNLMHGTRTNEMKACDNILILDVFVSDSYNFPVTEFDPIPCILPRKAYMNFMDLVEEYNYVQRPISNFISLKKSSLTSNGFNPTIHYIHDELVSIQCIILEKSYESALFHTPNLCDFKLINMGRYSFRVIELNGPNKIDIHIDVSKTPYFMGLIPGTILELTDIRRMTPKSNNFYCQLTSGSTFKKLGFIDIGILSNEDDLYKATPLKFLCDIERLKYIDKRVYHFEGDIVNIISCYLSQDCNRCGMAIKQNQCMSCPSTGVTVNFRATCVFDDGSTRAKLFLGGDEMWNILDLSLDDKTDLLEVVSSYGRLKYSKGSLVFEDGTLLKDSRTDCLNVMQARLRHKVTPVTIYGDITDQRLTFSNTTKRIFQNDIPLILNVHKLSIRKSNRQKLVHRLKSSLQFF